jgi:hypothetical protein
MKGDILRHSRTSTDGGHVFFRDDMNLIHPIPFVERCPEICFSFVEL